MSNSTSTKQNFIVLLVAIAALAASAVFMTLYVSGALNFDGESQERGYQNVTFTDAVVSCEKSTRKRFGKNIHNLVLDSHSSRYEDKKFLYKIFFNMDIKAGDNRTSLSYVNCFVKSSNGSIAKYEVFEDKAPKTEPLTNESTNMFGWPK